MASYAKLAELREEQVARGRRFWRGKLCELQTLCGNKECERMKRRIESLLECKRVRKDA